VLAPESKAAENSHLASHPPPRPAATRHRGRDACASRSDSCATVAESCRGVRYPTGRRWLTICGSRNAATRSCGGSSGPLRCTTVHSSTFRAEAPRLYDVRSVMVCRDGNLTIRLQPGRTRARCANCYGGDLAASTSRHWAPHSRSDAYCHLTLQRYSETPKRSMLGSLSGAQATHLRRLR